jgi:hypothetical protein
MHLSRLLVMALVLGVACGALCPPAAAQVLPYDPIVYGNLAAAWQQHVMRIPVPANPTVDLTGVNALVAQSGPVYFLAGAPTTDPVVRHVTLPPGKHLFFPLVTVECSTVEAPPFFGSNYVELSQCAGSFFAPSDVLSCTIDGVAVANLQSYRAQSPLYTFRMPPQNNILGLPGVKEGLSVADGYWLLLQPLAAGTHVIHFTALLTTGIGAGFSQDITYHINVAN